jgi:uncharacterized membrane protein
MAAACIGLLVARKGASPGWTLPVIAVVGLAVALYLTYIETTRSEAFCGAVGDCNAVQQSPYAMLFGFLPIALLGTLGYVAILGVWLVKKAGKGSAADLAGIGLLALAGFGVLFSIYLTFLEPFVIRATCAWCLTSALAMLLILWLSLGEGVEAARRLQRSAS